jgi:transcriptional regulator with XRE-family HTH domain
MQPSPGLSPPDGVPSGDPDLDALLRLIGILRASRQQQQLTLRDLTEKMGIDFAHLSRAERGLTQPGLVVLLRWCRALGLKFEDVWRQASGES